MEEKQGQLHAATSLTQVEKSVHISLVVTDKEGQVRGLFSGLHPAYADVLKTSHQSDDYGEIVKKHTDELFTGLGQDSFSVTYDFLDGTRHMLYPAMSFKDIRRFKELVPAGQIYTVVVSY